MQTCLLALVFAIERLFAQRAFTCRVLLPQSKAHSPCPPRQVNAWSRELFHSGASAAFGRVPGQITGAVQRAAARRADAT
eukprot:6183463-Pleurochrysis_carterae.AAC.1